MKSNIGARQKCSACVRACVRTEQQLGTGADGSGGLIGITLCQRLVAAADDSHGWEGAAGESAWEEGARCIHSLLHSARALTRSTSVAVHCHLQLLPPFDLLPPPTLHLHGVHSAPSIHVMSSMAAHGWDKRNVLCRAADGAAPCRRNFPARPLMRPCWPSRYRLHLYSTPHILLHSPAHHSLDEQYVMRTVLSTMHASMKRVRRAGRALARSHLFSTPTHAHRLP